MEPASPRGSRAKEGGGIKGRRGLFESEKPWVSATFAARSERRFHFWPLEKLPSRWNPWRGKIGFHFFKLWLFWLDRFHSAMANRIDRNIGEGRKSGNERESIL